MIFFDGSIIDEQSSRIQHTCRNELHMESSPEMLLGQKQEKKRVQSCEMGSYGTLLYRTNLYIALSIE